MNPLSSRATLMAGLAVAGLTLSAGTASLVTPAHATAVTVGDFYQEGSFRTSLSPPTAANCSASANCFVIFNIVPAGKQLLITNVSCRLGLVGTGADQLSSARLVTYLSTNARTDRGHVLSLTWSSIPDPSRATYNLVAETKQLLKSGERPVIELLTPGSSVFFDPICSISGKVGNPPTE